MNSPAANPARIRKAAQWFLIAVAVLALLGGLANEWYVRSSYNQTLLALQNCVGKKDPAHNLSASPGIIRGLPWRQIDASSATQIVQLRWWSPIATYQMHVLTTGNGEVLSVSTSGNRAMKAQQLETEEFARATTDARTRVQNAPRQLVMVPGPRKPVVPVLHLDVKWRPKGGAVDRSVVQLDCHADPERPKGGLLTRELYRQALLIAAREELHLGTRDRVLREALDIQENGPHPPLNLVVEPNGDALRIRAVRWDGKRDIILKEWTAPLPAERQVAEITTAAEAWSRSEFVDFLKSDGFEPIAGQPAGESEIPAAAQEQAARFNVISQYAALRQLHREIRERGESPKLIAGLSRSYALLGSLGDYFWSTSPKAFRARALLYAERLVQQQPQSAQALHNRAFVRALVGLPGDALADLEDAGKLQSGQPIEPALAIVRSYCLGELPLLETVAEDEPESTLACYLWMRGIDDLSTEEERMQAAKRMLNRAPDCMRACEVIAGKASLGPARAIVGLQQAMFAASLYDLVADAELLPKPQIDSLRAKGGVREFDLSSEVSRRVALLKALREGDATGRDTHELSLDVLVGLIQDVSLVHANELLNVSVRMLAANDDETLDQLKPLVEGHPFALLLDSFRWGREYPPQYQLLMSAPYTDLDSFALPLVDRVGGYTEGPVAADEIQRHRDQVHQDFVSALLYDKHVSDVLRPALTAQFQQVSPHALPVAVARIRDDWKSVESQASEWEQTYRDNVHVLQALVKRYMELDRSDDAERCQQRVLKLHPNQTESRLLAEIYKRRGDTAKWQSTLVASLDLPSFALEDASSNADLADHLMRQGKWKDALPFAQRSAESYSRRGLECAADCYEGLQDWKHANELYLSIAKRYENTPLDWYRWCRRTGHGDIEAARKATAHS